MTPKKSGAKRSKKNLGRKSKNTFKTKSGKEIKIHKSLWGRYKARKAANAEKRAERLAGMPKSRVKRVFYRLHPKRVIRYWFSREGFIMAMKLAGIGILIGFLTMVGVFAYFRKDLPNITDFSGNNIGGSIQYYDKTGEVLLWEDFDAVKRIPVPGEQISDNVKKAMIAIEDQDFFEHGGFDVRGISRAAARNVLGRAGDTREGGSTITQQLVRLTQPEVGTEQTYSRKLKELILAVELEREYSKDQILTGYLNVAPFGNIQYGVEVAANDYFHKTAKELDLAESAFLAAIPKSPSIYSPYGPYYDKDALLARQHYILDLMVQQQMVTSEEAEKAKKVNILKKVKKPQAKYTGIKHPYFALAAKSEIETRFGTSSANRGGWKVITTLDRDLQKLAEKAVKDTVPTIRANSADSAAFVAEEVETGHIVALVGGTDFNNKDYGKINYAHDAYIPPGSSFKPYDYAALIEHSDNVGAGSVLYDSKTPLPGYPCTDKGLPPPRGTGNCLQNYDFRTPGPLTLRYALGGSRNIPAVKAALAVGMDKTISMASKMMYNVNDMENGRSSYNCYADELFEQTAPCYGAAAIGDGAFLHLDDHVNGLATFSRLGKAIPRTYIMKVTDASGKTIYEYEKPEGEQVIRPDTAYIVNDMASDPNASYLRAGYYKFHDYKGWDFAIKTGTTNNGFDGLMAAWSTKYAAVSWVGHHTRNVELTGFMETMTTPITKTWMEGAHDKAGTPKNWEKPEGVKTHDAFVVRTHVGLGSVEPSPSKDLYPSWYKPPAGTSSSNKRIDMVSNKIATECTPERAIKKAGGANSNIFSVDPFVDGGSNTATDEKDDVHDCGDTKPSVTLTPASYLCNGTCTISATIYEGTHPLHSSRFPGTVNLIIGDKVVASKTVKGPQSVSFKYTPDFSGTKKLRVEVIDSVLYDGSATGDITSNNGSGGDKEKIDLSAERDGTDVIYSWSGGVGLVSIRRADNDEEICSGSSDDQCTGSIANLPANRKVYAIDTAGNKSKEIQVDI